MGGKAGNDASQKEKIFRKLVVLCYFLLTQNDIDLPRAKRYNKYGSPITNFMMQRGVKLK